jgi:hypothetical protein
LLALVAVTSAIAPTSSQFLRPSDRRAAARVAVLNEPKEHTMSKTELSLEELAFESVELLPDRETMQVPSTVAVGAAAAALNSVHTGDIRGSTVLINQVSVATAINVAPVISVTIG